MNECVIYDFETLSQDPARGVVISFAILAYSETRFASNPYTYEELLKDSKVIKFNVEEQVRTYKRTVSKDTIDWWKEQNKEAQKQLAPSANDVSIDVTHDFLCANLDLGNIKKSFSRGNTFDPMFLDAILKDCGKISPIHWASIRDTRSYIEGLSYGSTLKNSFVPEGLAEKFVKHDPRHDIVMDVMRMQTLIQAIS